MDTFDYVIVGAGPAGCILAYRLGARGHSVCVIEAGPADSSPYIRIPAGVMKTYKDPSITWQFAHEGSRPMWLVITFGVKPGALEGIQARKIHMLVPQEVDACCAK